MFFKRKLLAALLAGILSLGIFACESEGPAERAGEQIDEAIDESGERLEKAGERLEESTE